MKKAILWVDDDRYFVAIHAEILEDAGYEILHEIDASSGISTYEAHEGRVCCAVLDMAMDPGARFDQFRARGGYSSGMLVARNIHFKNKELPIVALTTFLDLDNQTWFKQRKFPYILKSEYSKNSIAEQILRFADPDRKNNSQIFIVHGHDDGSVLQLKNFLQNSLRLPEPIVLHEQFSGSRTVIEKFEAFSRDISAVFVMMTPDDVARKVGGTADALRARQNVVFELGYFYGKLGRRSGRVILLHKGGLEIPSDIAGVVYIDISNGIEASGESIRRELRELL